MYCHTRQHTTPESMKTPRAQGTSSHRLPNTLHLFLCQKITGLVSSFFVLIFGGHVQQELLDLWLRQAVKGVENASCSSMGGGIGTPTDTTHQNTMDDQCPSCVGWHKHAHPCARIHVDCSIMYIHALPGTFSFLGRTCASTFIRMCLRHSCGHQCRSEAERAHTQQHTSTFTGTHIHPAPHTPQPTYCALQHTRSVTAVTSVPNTTTTRSTNPSSAKRHGKQPLTHTYASASQPHSPLPHPCTHPFPPSRCSVPWGPRKTQRWQTCSLIPPLCLLQFFC